MESHIRAINIGVKMIVSILKKVDLVERKYAKQTQSIHFSPTEQKNNKNKT